MDDISFTTYLKLTLLPTTQGRLGTLQRMMNSSSGYDFYKQMKFAAREVAKGEVDPSEIFGKLDSIKSKVEREHNKKMAQNFLDWWNAQDGAVPLSRRPGAVHRAENMEFGIKMRPELAYEIGGQKHVVYLWATKTPALTKQGVGAGLHLLRKELAKGFFSDARFSLLNLRKKELITESMISNQSHIIVSSDIAGINQLWKSFG